MRSCLCLRKPSGKPRRAANAGKADVQPAFRLSLMSTFPALRSALRLMLASAIQIAEQTKKPEVTTCSVHTKVSSGQSRKKDSTRQRIRNQCSGYVPSRIRGSAGEPAVAEVGCQPPTRVSTTAGRKALLPPPDRTILSKRRPAGFGWFFRSGAISSWKRQANCVQHGGTEDTEVV